MLEELKKKLSNKWSTLEKLHIFILSINPKIEYRIFPIYIRYCLGEKIVALVYFRGKFVSNNQLDVGLSLKEKPKFHGFINAKYMQYPGINYSIKITNKKGLAKNISKIIKSTILIK